MPLTCAELPVFIDDLRPSAPRCIMGKLIALTFVCALHYPSKESISA